MMINHLCLYAGIFSAMLVLTTFTGYAQIALKGKVIQLSGTPVPFANIGIRGKNVGTISDSDGSFLLQLKPGCEKDTLTVSCIGFEEVSKPICLMMSESVSEFRLTEKIRQLDEVVITSRKPKVRRIGVQTVNPLLWGNATSKDGNDIIEMGKLISIRKPATLRQTSIYLKGVTIDSATFRINFYSVKNNLPDQRLTERAILVRANIKKGWLHTDLTPYSLAFDRDFFITYEFLPTQKRQKYVFSYGGQFGSGSVSRQSSLGNWEQISGAGLSCYVTVQQ